MIAREELEQTLAAMTVEWPDEVDLREAVLEQLERSSTRGWRGRHVAVAALAVVAVSLSVVLLTPGPRAAVARLLGFPGITVQRSSEPLPELTGIDLGTPTTLAAARARFDVQTLPLADHGVFVDEPSGAVHIAYRLADGTPVLLTQLQGGDDPYLAKQAPRVVPTKVGSAFALWVTGREHAVITVGAVRDEARLSDNALLWAADGVTYRLEADVALGVAVDLAESLR